MTRRKFLTGLGALLVAGPAFAYKSLASLEMNKDRRPIFVFVKADHCPYCRRMEKVLENPVIANFIDQNFQMITFNSSRVPLPTVLQPLYGTPTSYILSKDGTVLLRQAGAMSSKTLLHFLEDGLEKNARFVRENGVIDKGVPVQ